LSNKFSRSHARLSIEVRSSKFLLTAIAVLALLALAAIAHTAIALSLRMLLGLATLAYLGWQWRWQARQQGILLWRDGWQWLAGDHSARIVDLRRAVIWPALVVLSFRDTAASDDRWWRRRNLTLSLCRDSLTADDMRRLRAYLRHWPVLDEARFE